MIRQSRKVHGPYTVDDFFSLVHDGQKGDLIDGVIYMASPDSLRANNIAFFLGSLMRWYTSTHKIGGRCCINRVAFVLSNENSPEPDVAYVTKEHMGLLASGRVLGAPDIAVEVVSHDSIERDYDLKRAMYEAAGVPEYWIVDPIEARVEILLLRGGRYEAALLENGKVFRSTVIPGFWVNVEWLLADPLPDDNDCFLQILGG